MANAEVFQRVAREHKLSSKLNPIFTRFPELEDCCERVAAFIGDKFVGDEKPLVLEMLETGISAYKRAKKEGKENLAFMQALFERSDRLYAKRFIAVRGETIKVWYPMVESLPDFEQRHSTYKIETLDEPCIERITKRTAACQLAARALRGEMFRLYFEDYDVAHYSAD
ncbi:conserved protein of unknown function (plasmid) [Pararobbsia alpina]|uniref:hypothetical protein n=1 Tax=Pararobbsia alpina TaxID=621374 RepID=UPI0039A72515